jgi:hypothetical protein
LFFDHKYPIYYTGENGFASPQPITKEAFKRVVNKVKEECEGAARKLMFELEKCFLEHEVMIIFDVIYPQFWTKNIVKVNALEAIFYVPCKLGENGKIGLFALLSTHDLDL